MKALKFLVIIMTLDMFSSGQVSSTATRANLYRMVMNFDSTSQSRISIVDSASKSAVARLDSTEKAVGRKKVDSTVFAAALSDMLALALQNLAVSGDTITITNGNRVVVTPTSWSKMTGKPIFAAVATSGSYADLSGTPMIPSSYPWTSLTGKPTFATVATTGAYADLSGKPTIPTIPSSYDWTAITNKPSFTSVATSGAYNDLSGRPVLATVATSGSYADLSNKPMIPTVKRTETYSGATNASGNYVVTFTAAFTVAPNIQAQIVPQTNDGYFIKVSAVSTTGFTVNVFSRAGITSLPIVGTLTAALLGATTTPVSGQTVDVVVFEK